MGSFTKPSLPQEAGDFTSCLSGSFSQMISSFTGKRKNAPKLKPWMVQTRGVSGGPAMSSIIAFMLSLSQQPGLRALPKAYLRTCFEIDEDVRSQAAEEAICLLCSGIVWQAAATAAKVTGRCHDGHFGCCCMLTCACPPVPCTLPGDHARRVIHFLPVSAHETRFGFGCSTFP